MDRMPGRIGDFIWLLLGVSLLVSSCGRSEDAPAAPSSQPSDLSGLVARDVDSLPTIIVDAAHAMRQDRTGLVQPSIPYTLKAGAAITVASRTFKINDPEHLSREPNTIRVLYDGSEYSAHWHPDSGNASSFTLDRNSLTVVKGSTFRGFEAGKLAAIGIGYASSEHDKPFKEFWVGEVVFVQ